MGLWLTLGVDPAERTYEDIGRDNVTTGEVALWLEAKYSVMDKFWQMRGDDVAHLIVHNAVLAMEQEANTRAVMTTGIAEEVFRMGAKQSMDDTKELFDTYLTQQEHGMRVSPTVARHRHKGKRAKPESVTAFVDTGQYRDSFYCGIKE